ILRTVFHFPDRSGKWIDRHARHVAMAHGVDLRPVTGLADERVIPGDAAVRVEAQNFAAIATGVLCATAARMGIFPGIRRDITGTGAHIELAVPTEDDSGGGVLADADAVVDDVVVDEEIVDARQGMA